MRNATQDCTKPAYFFPTVFLGIFLGLVALGFIVKNATDWKALAEFGSYIGGMASVVALLAVAVTLQLQGSELALQRRELEESRAQFTKQADELKRQADLQAKQLNNARMASQLQAIITYFQQGDADEHASSRARILEATTAADIDADDARRVCSFFHFWGLMERHELLPISVFVDSMSGKQVIRLHKKLLPYINDRRTVDPEYAEEFSKVVARINSNTPKSASGTGALLQRKPA